MLGTAYCTILQYKVSSIVCTDLYIDLYVYILKLNLNKSQAARLHGRDMNRYMYRMYGTWVRRHKKVRRICLVHRALCTYTSSIEVPIIFSILNVPSQPFTIVKNRCMHSAGRGRRGAALSWRHTSPQAGRKLAATKHCRSIGTTDK